MFFLFIILLIVLFIFLYRKVFGNNCTADSKPSYNGRHYDDEEEDDLYEANEEMMLIDEEERRNNHKEHGSKESEEYMHPYYQDTPDELKEKDNFDFEDGRIIDDDSDLF